MPHTQIPISDKIHYQIFDTLEDCVYVINAQEQLLMFNQAFVDLYQGCYHEPPQLYDHAKSVYADACDDAKLSLWYARGLAGEKFSEMILHDGKRIELLFKPIFTDTKKAVEALVIQLKEVTQSYQLKAAVSAQQERYQYVIDNVHDILFQTDATGNWIFLNKAWTTVMQYALEESIGKPFFNFLHPEDVEKNQLLFEPLVNRKKSYCKHVIRYLNKAGEIKWIEVFATLSLDENDQIVGTAGTLKDLTNEMKNAHIYELLSNNVKDLVCIHDLEGKYLYVSPSIKHLTGFEPKELVGQTPYDFIHPDDLSRIAEKHAEIRSTINSFNHVDYRFRKKDGSYVWLEANARVFFDEYDIAYRVISSSREVEARKRAEESMMKALLREKELNELMAKFVNFASHEFRTPLATIQSSTEIIEAYTQNIAQPQRVHRHTHLIHAEIDRITRLIDEILLIGKIDSEQLVAKKEPVYLLDVLSKVIYRQNALQKDGRTVQLVIEGQASASAIYIDAQQLDLSIDNLLSNAFKYSLGKPNPIVTVQFEPAEVKILIQDFGIGIPIEEQEKLFTSFFRANNVGHIKGTGLGLVIVKNFIELNGGNVSFESTLQQGTTFCVSLPYVFS